MKKKRAAERPLKTIDRVLSKAGLASRTEAEQWVRAGRVKLNGRLVRSVEQWVDLERDRVTIDGQPITAKRRLYLLLYKPTGCVTTRTDPDGRPTVYDLLESITDWVFPVGRLDQHTSGLLLLTNDADFAEQVTNPKFKVPKTYLAKVAPRLTDVQLDELRAGVTLRDGPTRPAKVSRNRDSGNHTFLTITITEGRNRQVRRMLEAVGAKTLKLVRTAIGPLTLGGLQIGKYRALSGSEVKAVLASRIREAADVDQEKN